MYSAAYMPGDVCGGKTLYPTNNKLTAIIMMGVLTILEPAVLSLYGSHHNAGHHIAIQIFRAVVPQTVINYVELKLSITCQAAVVRSFV